jgi:methionyl-tRNA synthetase
MNLIYLFGVWSAPLIPTSAETIRSTFGSAGGQPTWISADEARSLDLIEAGQAFATPAVLFSKISDDDLDRYRARFGGEPDSDSADPA